ncbi:LOW QUALITY PROTEIN: immunoglobulin alpha Fc receptor-like [Manis javanica]|uniref:LOW QUALITY PROTEIN: immunoglobulin alpha Fc receptor-like n=1 Tax=Manis javanica TaxID=9974 RepID=UPI003C6CD444
MICNRDRKPKGRSTLRPSLPVLCLSQEVGAQGGDSPVPVVSAAPGSVVPGNESVTILCWGDSRVFPVPPGTLENSTYKVVEKKLEFQKKADCIINCTDADTAGHYQGRYEKHHSWSERSDPLELVGTGEQPFLPADPGRVARLGERLSLQCGLAHVPFDRFSLAKDGEAALSQHQNGGHHGNFIVGPVNPSFSGNYSCYGWYSGSPYMWLAPSEAPELVVTDIMNQDCTMETGTHMGVAGLVPVALVAILAEHWLHRQASHKGDRPGLSWSRWECQRMGLWTKPSAPQADTWNGSAPAECPSACGRQGREVLPSVGPSSNQ